MAIRFSGGLGALVTAVGVAFSAPVTSGKAPAPTHAAGEADVAAQEKILDKILAGEDAGIDTTAFLEKLDQRLEWGEKDERLVEARGILRFRQGQFAFALADFRRVEKPAPLTLTLLGEGLEWRGEKYEAATQYRMAARAYPVESPERLALLRKYLKVYPRDQPTSLEAALLMEKFDRWSESAPYFVAAAPLLAREPKNVLRVAAGLSKAGSPSAARDILSSASLLLPDNASVQKAYAEVLEAGGEFDPSLDVWMKLWDASPKSKGYGKKAVSLIYRLPEGMKKRTLLTTAAKRFPRDGELQGRTGLAWIKAGDTGQAKTHLQRAIALRNPDGLVRKAFISTLSGEKEVDKHFRLVEQVLKEGEAGVRTWEMAAQGYGRRGQSEKACTAWQQVWEKDSSALESEEMREALLHCSQPEHRPAFLAASTRALKENAASPPWLLALAKAHRADGKDEKLAALAPRLLRALPDSKDFLKDAAAEWDRKNRPESARKLRRLMAENGDGEAALTLGLESAEAGDCATAMPYLKTAGTTRKKALRPLAPCLLAAGDSSAALDAYAALPSPTPEESRRLADLYAARGQTDRESETLARLVAEKRAERADLLRLAELQAEAGRHREAFRTLDLLSEAGEIPTGKDWKALALQYGRHLAEGKRTSQAVIWLRHGLQRKTGDGDPTEIAADWKRVGDLESGLRRYDAACEAYARAAELGPGGTWAEDLAGAWGWVAQKSGRTEMIVAVQKYRVSLDPENADARRNLADAALKKRDFKGAIPHLRDLAKMNPTQGKVWAELGHCLALDNQWKEAAGALQKALDLNVDDEELFINRARAYRRNGDPDLAESILEFLLSRNPRSYLALSWSAKFAEEDGKPRLADEFKSRLPGQKPKGMHWPELAALATD